MKKAFLFLSLLMLAVTAVQGQPHPYVTGNTRLVPIELSSFDHLGDPSEGIVSVQQRNPEVSSATRLYSFYRLDGHCLFGPWWEEPVSYSKPRFDQGLAVAKRTTRNARFVKPICILYADGGVLVLPDSVKFMTQFYDGVAKVCSGEFFYYVDGQGRHIWPHLDYLERSFGPSLKAEHMRPLREGRRAYFDGATQKWGFLDSAGRVVIQPQYKEVRDFAGGYALVVLDGKGVFIDPSGRTACETGKSVYALQDCKISDVDHGIYSIHDYDEVDFYRLDGTQTKSFSPATPFSHGFFFARGTDILGEKRLFVYDHQFDVAATLSNDHLDRIAESRIVSPQGIITWHQEVVTLANGAKLLDLEEGLGYARVGGFNADNQARFCCEKPLATNGSERFYGVLSASGEALLLFGKRGANWGSDPLVPVEPVEPTPPPDTATFAVRLRVVPAQGGTAHLTGNGRYRYNETVEVHGRASEGWVLGGVEHNLARTDQRYRYQVRDTGTVTVYFVKNEDGGGGNTGGGNRGGNTGGDTGGGKTVIADPPRTTITDTTRHLAFYGGTLDLTKEGIEVEGSVQAYLEFNNLNDYDSPFGQGTCGMLTLLFDTDRTYYTSELHVGVHLFMVPLRVQGLMKEGGKDYLVVDGGNLVRQIIQDGNPFSLLIGTTGWTIADLLSANGHYRVELLEVDANSFTFGRTERYCTTRGCWLPGSDPIFDKILDKQNSAFMHATLYEFHLPTTFFQGTRMSRTPKQTIPAFPPRSFYESDQEHREGTEQIKEQYRNFASDYELFFRDPVTEF